MTEHAGGHYANAQTTPTPFMAEVEPKPLAAFGGLIAAERDELRAEVARLTGELEQARRWGPEMERAQQHAESWRRLADGWQARADKAEATVALWQPVIDAAKAWREGWGPGWIRALTGDGRRDLTQSRTYALIAAVDALDARGGQTGGTKVTIHIASRTKRVPSLVLDDELTDTQTEEGTDE